MMDSRCSYLSMTALDTKTLPVEDKKYDSA